MAGTVSDSQARALPKRPSRVAVLTVIFELACLVAGMTSEDVRGSVRSQSTYSWRVNTSSGDQLLLALTVKNLIP
jgi:hypothetical protein